VDHESQASWFVKPRLTVLVHASVAKEDVRVGEMVELIDGIVPIERVRGGRVPQGTWQAKTPLVKGGAVSLAHVQRVPDAERGDSIIVSVRRDNIHLTAEGELLGDAHIGDTVQTLNHATHATLTGVLVSPHLVEIQ
jgi:flagella basal body P-ring formation protein FlgA